MGASILRAPRSPIRRKTSIDDDEQREDVSLTIGSLFAGIGGIELGLEWAGLGPVVWQVEKDPFCRDVLARHWPGVERHEDVEKCGKANLASVGIICGGFPCQDTSSAGSRRGLDGKSSGLWREFRRIVEELRPPFAVVENVASGATRWLCEVRGQLEALGYRTRALGVAARDVGAPHRRSRIFVVAHSDGIDVRDDEQRESRRRARSVSNEGEAFINNNGQAHTVANATRKRRPRGGG